MIMGMLTPTIAHVLISLVGILTGCIVVFGLFVGNPLNGWTALFLAAAPYCPCLSCKPVHTDTALFGSTALLPCSTC